VFRNFHDILKLMKLSEPQVQFVERVGRFWEGVAMGRSAGRILGWLMICEPVHQSAADLVSTLGMSTGSVSTQIRQLQRMGLVERLTFPGDRASYYQLPESVWSKSMNTEFERLADMRALAASAVEVLPTERPERVSELALVAEFFAEEWQGLTERLAERLAKVEA